MANTRGESESRGWRPREVLPGVDVERPSAARIYDYYLGGAHNFAADRRLADEAVAAWPELPAIMRANRGFLRRAVRFLVDAGVRQFLDLGSGIPTAGNVHAVAQQSVPLCRVAYVDIDPVVVAHSRAILDGSPGVVAVQADLRDPSAVLANPQIRELFDLSQPVAVLLVAVMHFVPDTDHPEAIVAGYRDAVAPGSYLAICHASPADRPNLSGTHQDLYARTSTPMSIRRPEQIAAFFDGWTMVEPGLVLMARWRPDPREPTSGRPEDYPGHAGVARKP